MNANEWVRSAADCGEHRGDFAFDAFWIALEVCGDVGCGAGIDVLGSGDERVDYTLRDGLWGDLRAGDVFDHVGVDETGHDADDERSVFRELGADALGERIRCGFGSGVTAPFVDSAENGKDVDDGAAASAFERGGKCAGGGEDAEVIDAHFVLRRAEVFRA